MPLRIKMPHKERIIINGTIVENVGDTTTLVLHNKADVMRRKEVMVEEEAVTPARKIYYTLQCGYIFSEERDKYIKDTLELIREYLEAVPASKDLCASIVTCLKEGSLYASLRKSRELIEYEDELVSLMKKRIDD